MKEISEETKIYRDRYLAAMHAVQSGVKMILQHEGMDEEYTGSSSRKHLRVGVNSALLDSSALAKTLFEANVITEEAYFKNLAQLAEEEKERYEKEITAIYGDKVKITLG